jgi:hypothetical protein
LASGARSGLVGALIGMGMPEYEAKRYEGLVKNGGTLQILPSQKTLLRDPESPKTSW